MARRSGAVNVIDTQRARASAAAQLRTMLSRWDVAEYQAQTHAAKMVDLLAAMAADEQNPKEFRRQCANDVLNRAYGMPATKATVTFVDPSAKTDSGTTVGQQIEAIKEGAGRLQLLDQFVGKIDPCLWPAEIQEIAGDLMAVYSEIDESPKTES